MKTPYEIIIVGGSYAGLQAALTLGRALRHVLVIDSGQPCNRQTPHSHNFLTRDGETPAALISIARAQLSQYITVELIDDEAVSATATANGYIIQTAAGRNCEATRLLFATGIKDLLPALPGLGECWGISALHCPYCHGFEVRNLPTAILAHGDLAAELAALLSHWTDQLMVFTHGPADLNTAQQMRLATKQITIIEEPIRELRHSNGQLKAVQLQSGADIAVQAAYLRVPFVQHCLLPEQLGCALTTTGLLQIDNFGRTSQPGIYAAGDCTSPKRAVGAAASAGMMAAAFLNKELIDEHFYADTKAM